MIKGYYFKEQPDLETRGYKDPVSIIKELDPLNETSDPEEINTGEFKCTKKNFASRHLIINAYSTVSSDHYDGIYQVFSIIERADPNLLTVVKYTPQTIIIAKHKFRSNKSNTLFSLLIDELSRITAYHLTYSGGDEEETVNFLQGYLKLCISTPLTRFKNKVLGNLDIEDGNEGTDED